MTRDSHTDDPPDPGSAGVDEVRQEWAELIPRYERKRGMLSRIDHALRDYPARSGRAVMVTTRTKGLVMTVCIARRDGESLDTIDEPVLNISTKGTSITINDGEPGGFGFGSNHSSCDAATREAMRRLELWHLRGGRLPPRPSY